MEKIILLRTNITDKYTQGELWYNNQFICYTLEDPIRDKKIKHETAIPFGNYQVIMNYSNRFKQIMPLLLNVPNYQGIRIHKGNTTSNTSGCILVGTNIQKDKLLYSTIAYFKVLTLLRKLLKKGKVEIEIQTKPITQSWTQKTYFPNLLKSIFNL